MATPERISDALGPTATAGVLIAGAASAAPAAGWTANPGTTVADNGVVRLDSTGTPFGTSLENSNLSVPVHNGDTISFQYSGTCYAGGPRVFIQGGVFNTYDNNPNQCGGPVDANGYRTVTATVHGIVDGTAGYTGIVNDSGPGSSSPASVILVRNVTINGVVLQLAAPVYKNHGQCVRSSDDKNAAAQSDCGK